MPSENAMSVLVLFISSFAATGTSLILSLGVTASYLRRKRVGWFGGLVGAAAVLAAVLAAWTAVSFTTLAEEDQLSDMGLKDLMASYERTRAVYDLAGEALFEPLRRQVAAHLDAQQDALNALETSIWGFHRAGPWNENRLLYHLHSNVVDLMILQTKLETALGNVDCGSVVTAGEADWPDLLLEAWQKHVLNLGVLGEGFAGNDFVTEDAGYVSKTYASLRYLAGTILSIGVVLLIAGGVVAFRRQSVTRSDAVIMLTGAGVAAAALALFAFSRLGAGELLERSFVQARDAYLAALTLQEPLRSAERKQFSPPVTVLFPDFAGDHRAYFGEVHRLNSLVRAWGEAVLLGEPTIDSISLNGTLNRDELPDRVREQLVRTFRTFVFLGKRLRAYHCEGAAAPESDPLRHYRKVWEQPPGFRHPLEEMMESR